MLTPRKLKYRKVFRGKRAGVSMRANTLAFGSFGIKALSRNWITARQIEAARRAITRYIRRGGKVWIRIFPDKPVTAQPAETGMGGGKGGLDHFVAVVRPGQILFEMDGTTEEIAREALRLGAHKLAVKVNFLSKTEQ